MLGKPSGPSQQSTVRQWKCDKHISITRSHTHHYFISHINHYFMSQNSSTRCHIQISTTVHIQIITLHHIQIRTWCHVHMIASGYINHYFRFQTHQISVLHITNTSVLHYMSRVPYIFCHIQIIASCHKHISISNHQKISTWCRQIQSGSIYFDSISQNKSGICLHRKVVLH